MGVTGARWFTQITWKKYLCIKKGLYFLYPSRVKKCFTSEGFSLVTKIGWWIWVFHRLVSHLALSHFFSRWKWRSTQKHGLFWGQSEWLRKCVVDSRGREYGQSACAPWVQDASGPHAQNMERHWWFSPSVMSCEWQTRQVFYVCLKTGFMRS